MTLCFFFSGDNKRNNSIVTVLHEDRTPSL